MLLNKIYNMDCLEGMAMLPNKSVDMILCDLPYGVTNQNKWDQIIPFDKLWEQYNRLIKDNGAIVLTAVKPFSSMLIMSNPKMYRYDIVWSKNKSTGFLNAKKMPLRAHEEILVFYKKLPTYNPQKTTGHKPANSYTKHTSDGTNYGKTKHGISGGGQTDRYPTSVWDIKVMNNDDPHKFHPTQKPIELFEKLIKTYSNEGELILDNCMGAGTTAAACIKTNRKYIGFEIEKEYYSKSLEYIKTVY
ncbi:site-specific DNA-methyltransferase [Alkalihalophilus pseudofirmus]|uniref:DNA-methyltransferase n=1 Tax=Alkalihalophilus pseudofirmus TaxID=79885 RepID=UPI00259B23ED|nr:site-specific DNA-methyltransferase [Alkalihalophilus pseudofirmus]WEG18657.1 site-specific DNA-methyltransferase [Alkalihalophilus pseudofirmus]